jgi:hypothetical protein
MAYGRRRGGKKIRGLRGGGGGAGRGSLVRPRDQVGTGGFGPGGTSTGFVRGQRRKPAAGRKPPVAPVRKKAVKKRPARRRVRRRISGRR